MASAACPARTLPRPCSSAGAPRRTPYKHPKERRPYHYHSGFALSESARQDIANPEIKALEQTIQTTKRQLGRLYKQLAKSKPSTNKDATPRANGKSQRLAAPSPHRRPS